MDKITEPALTFENTEELVAFVQSMRKQKTKAQFSPLFSSDKKDWGTPNWFFKAVDSEFHFTCDVCASWENRKVAYFYSEEQDAFKRSWWGTNWCNPPYSTGIAQWFAHGLRFNQEANATVVYLVPSRTDTNWWFDYATIGEVRYLKGRLKFKGAPTSAPFPSALVIYRPGLPRSTSYWDYKEIAEEPGYRVERIR